MPEWLHTITVDASRDSGTGLTGVGIVIQARINKTGRGPILEEVFEVHEDPSAACEGLAILRGLEVAMLRGFSRIKMRSDSNPLRTKLRKALRSGSLTRLNDVQSKILALAREFAWVDFGYVPRRKNQIAHRLASVARLEALSVRGIEVRSRAPYEVSALDFLHFFEDDEAYGLDES